MSNIENFLNTAQKDIALIKTIQKTKFSEVYECRLDGKDAVLKIKTDCTFENEIGTEEIIVDQLHNSNIVCDDCGSFESKIKKYEHAIAQNSPNSLCRSAFKFIYELVARDKHQVFCHNDLNLSNIMYSDDIFFIDWDYAGFNHPYFDLALLFNAMNLTSNEEYSFLTIYADQENDIDHELLKEYKKMSLYVEYLWIVVTSSQENPKYVTRFDELSTLLR